MKKNGCLDKKYINNYPKFPDSSIQLSNFFRKLN